MLPSRLLLHRVVTPLLFILICCVGCAKDEALSENQKDQVTATLESAGVAYQAGRNVAEDGGSTSVSSNPGADWVSSAMALPLRRMSTLLHSRIQTNNCHVRWIAPNSYGMSELAPSASSFEFFRNWRELGHPSIKRTFVALKVWGDDECPVHLEFKIGTLHEPSIGRFAIAYDYSYQATDSTYQSWNDIDSVELHGGVSLNGLNSDQTRSNTNFKGTIHSQSSGNIQITADGALHGPNRDSLSGEILWKISYSDFTAEFRRSYDEGQISYSLNRQSIAGSDYDSYFTRGGEPLLYAAKPELVH